MLPASIALEFATAGVAVGVSAVVLFFAATRPGVLDPDGTPSRAAGLFVLAAGVLIWGSTALLEAFVESIAASLFARNLVYIGVGTTMTGWLLTGLGLAGGTTGTPFPSSWSNRSASESPRSLIPGTGSSTRSSR